MRIYTVEGPDGRIYEVEGPEGATNAQVVAAIRRQLAAQPAPAAPKESTIFGEVARGAKQLASSTRTGIGALVSPEEAARAGVERGQQIAAEAGEGPSLAALRKVYEERGLLPAAGELVSQIPRALAGQVPQLAAMAGGAKLGAMAGAPLGPAGVIGGGILGAGATLLPQFFGANIERQAAEQMERGEPVKIDRGTAAAAAAGQAGIEAAGTAFVLGKRVVKGVLGIADDAGLATAKARADLVKAAERSRLGAAGRGAAVGLAEIPVEVAQAVIERAQAGLDVLSPEAFTEYGENAYLAGLVGPTIGAATRVTEPGAARQKLAAEEQVKAGEARKAARAAEEAKKKDPQYLLDLDARYQAAMQQKAKLDAAIVKPPKDADPATKIAYRDAVRARDEFAKTEMAEVAREYAARKKDIDALGAQRQQEAELAAQEVPQAEQKLPYYESAQGTIPGLEAVETAEPAAPAEEAPDYAAQAQNLRSYLDDLREKAQTTTDLDAKLRIGEEFARVQKALDKAETLAKEEGQGVGKKIESLRRKMATAEESGDIAVQVDLAKQLKALGVTDLGAQAALDLGKPQALGKLQVPTDLADYQAAQQRAAEAKAAREAQQRQQQQLAKEAYERSLQTADLYSGIAAQQQRRAADRAAADAEARAEAERTQREEELVDRLVQATGAVQPQPLPQARMALPTGETTEGLYDKATELRAQLAFAQQTRNKNLEARVRQQLQQIGASPEEKGTALDLGATAREAGVEGELTPDAIAQNRMTRLAQRQLMSYDQLVRFITQAREREQTTVDEKTKIQYKYRAEQLKQAVIGFALQEINGRRQQYGLPELEQKEVMRAVTGLARPLNELIARGAQMFEEPVVVRGQQRGIRLVDGAQEFERPPAGKRTFSEAGFPAAADTLREEFRKTVETVSGVPAAPAAAPFGKPPGPVRKVVPEQRELFLTPPPAEEPVSLAPTALLNKAVDKAASGDDAQLLRQMQEIYTQLKPEQQSVVREQAQRAIDGKPLDAVYEMRGLYQLQQREAATAAGQQTFLKPITLVTARRKIERLAQQAAALEKQAAEAQAIVERIAAGRKSEVERAQAAFDRAREQGKDLIATASQLRGEQTKERLDAANKLAELELKKRELDKEWDDVVAGQFAWLQTRYAFLREEVAAGRAPKTNRAELAELERLFPGAIDRVVKASKALDRINKKIAAAKEAQQAVLERQAADTVTGALLKQATKAQNKIDAAQQKLSEARAAEKAAERVHKATLAAEPKAPTPLEQIEAMPITGVTRVFRDTSDPAVQAQATKKRSAIAREEGTYAILEERLKTAEGDDKVSLQRQLNESEARLQKLHNELYDVYSNAPMKRVQGTTIEAAASAERLEKAQHAVQDAEIDAFNAKHDTARLSLPPRKAGPMISEKGVVKQGGERVIKAEPATPIAEIASTRKRIDEINQQFAYIKDNPAKSAEGKAKQAKVKTQLAAERQTLVAKLKELLQSQREVVREEKAVERELKGARTVSKGAIKRSKLEATDAQLFEDLAKATKTKEQAALFERAENAFGEMSAPEQAFVRRQANAIVGRREADYKGAQLAEVVAAAERRMAREGDETVLPARGVEVESPDLAADQVKALEDNDVAQALALLSTDKSADPVHRAVAQRLAQLLDATDVEVRDTLTDSEGNPVLGQALASGKKIRLSRAGGLTQEVLLHEGTHAAAERILEAPESSLTPLQLAAKRELQALHAAIKRDPSITSTDAKASLSEFVAEVMSNRNLQQQLAKKPWRLSDALKAFKSVILRLLGVKETQSMLGAAMKSVDAIFQPTSVQTFKAEGVRTQYSQKDIAALHDGSNSMRQFAENFPQYIKQKDRTPEDVDRIGDAYLSDMFARPEDYVAAAEPDRLDYKSDTIMSDGTVFDPENPLHLVEATPTTFVALQAQKQPELRKEEAFRITEERQQALKGLIRLLNSGSATGVRKKPNVYGKTATSYTLPEQALVAKAASKYGVQSTPEGRLKLVTIDANNRHPVAVVSKEAANAVIEELRAGKNLKTAFLDGMQRVADDNAKKNSAKNGWQKFEVVSGIKNISRLYTQEEIGEAIGNTGYDGTEFADDDALVDQLISDGHLPDRSSLMQTATDVRSIEKAAIELNAGAAGTSWCTGASVGTAREQIRNGDFYIYYKDGRPEVAVRMNGTNKIGEIRGNTSDQWLTPEQQDIAAAFLKTSSFEGARDFLEETERKSKLTRIFSGKEVLGDSLVFSELINEDNTKLDTYFAPKLFSFDTLDGYASQLRPEPSEKTLASLSDLIDRVTNKDMAAGYFNANIDFGSGIGEVRYRGRTIKNIKPSDVVRAQSISTNMQDLWRVKDRVLTFDRLVRADTIYVFGSAKFPALKYVDDIAVGDYTKNTVIELGNETFVDNLNPMSGSAEVTVKGGYYVKVTPIKVYNKKYSVLTATITAPYVKVLPLRKVLDVKKPPQVEVNTPNKIDDAPPIEEIEAAAEERLLFARSNLPTAARVADQIVGQQKGWLQKLRENFLGIGGRAQFVDMRFPLEEVLKKGGVEDLDAMQAMYYVRMYDQKMHFTSEAITEGVPEVVEKTRKDGRTERIIEAKSGANLTQAYKILTSKEVIKEAGSADAANKLVTLYMAAIRGANKGYDKLNFGRAWATQEIKRLDGELKRKDLEPAERANLQKRKESLVERLDTLPTPEDIKASRAEIEANPVLREAFDKVREVYNEYNRNLLQLAVQTGAISKDHARALLAQNDYIPYYRMRGGVAEMVIGDETPIRIGNIKDNQELQELVGGDEPILDFLTSSMQNTSMLVDMSLRNIAMKNAMFELRDVGLATVAKEPKGGAPKGSVTFKKDGEDYYAVVNTDVLGISSDLLVKGLAGIPTMFPMWVRAMGVPARFLRRAIVAAPPYWAKQVFRDSLGAAMSSGANIVPVLGALRQIGKDNVLERRGITGGQVFTGLPEDKKRMLDAMQSGKVSLTRGMAWLEATAAKADALTRKNQYESYLAQGLSEMEATYMALESMNFSKRGLSPSVHYANILIPFFNSQIQGLDALYKAFTGKMPMNERLEIRQKLWTRGMLMFVMSMAYAWAMQDDEAYKNAKPDEKYGNWFVPLKHFGIDETLRLPIPFELGYIFKALPEAIVNSFVREEGAKEARDAFLHIAQQTIPGGSSLGIPAAVKPALETVLGVSSYTGRPLESAQEQMLEPGYRARENTTELARQIGEMTNFSPVKLEFLVRGYTGSMGMAALAALSAPLGGTGPEPATKRLTEMPVVGTLFQPKDAGGIIDATYERLNKVNQLVKTHEKLLQEGRVADAEKYFAEHQDDMALGSLAGSFKQFMGEVTQVERAVRSSPTMTPEKKREYLDYLRQVKIQAATSVRDSVRAASGRKTPQAAPA